MDLARNRNCSTAFSPIEQNGSRPLTPIDAEFWQNTKADLKASFNGTWNEQPNMVPLRPGIGQVYGSYEPATNTINLYNGADDVTEFEELLHWQDIQTAS